MRLPGVLCALALSVLIATSPPCAAAQPAADLIEAPLEDPADEARAQALFTELRCPVCTAQSIAESDAGTSGDLRRFVREQIESGATDEEIRAGLVARYGETIRLRPDVNAGTIALWLAPWAALVFGGVVLWRVSRARAPKADA